MSQGTWIVSVGSTKGGVGKTTLALALALDLAARPAEKKPVEKKPAEKKPAEKKPVVFIDADVLGTEVADLLSPLREGEWSLALLDVLSQSSGPRTLGQVVVERLVEAKKGGDKLPHVDSGAGLWVIPSVRWRDPTDRLRFLGAPGDMGRRLDLGLVTDSVSRFQLELRLTTLVGAILEVFEPSAIVIDHAPFHLPLAAVPRKWWDDKDLRDLLLDPVALDRRWKGRRVRQLEVAGPEEQDLLGFLAVLGDEEKRTQRWQNGTRWVLNRDLHLPGAGFEVCGTRKALAHSVQTWHELGHVQLQRHLALGMLGRVVGGPNLNEYIDQPLSYRELLDGVRNDLRPWVFRNDAFEQEDWEVFLA